MRCITLLIHKYKISQNAHIRSQSRNATIFVMSSRMPGFDLADVKLGLTSMGFQFGDGRHHRPAQALTTELTTVGGSLMSREMTIEISQNSRIMNGECNTAFNRAINGKMLLTTAHCYFTHLCICRDITKLLILSIYMKP